jgi:hypothetical protein
MDLHRILPLDETEDLDKKVMQILPMEHVYGKITKVLLWTSEED